MIILQSPVRLSDECNTFNGYIHNYIYVLGLQDWSIGYGPSLSPSDQQCTVLLCSTIELLFTCVQVTLFTFCNLFEGAGYTAANVVVQTAQLCAYTAGHDTPMCRLVAAYYMHLTHV